MVRASSWASSSSSSSVIGGFRWMPVARLVRAQFFSHAREGVRRGGARARREARRGRWCGTSCPTAMGPVIVAATIDVAAAIIAEIHAQSFLGLGFPPDIPTWGRILYDGQATIMDLAAALGAVPGHWPSSSPCSPSTSSATACAMRSILDGYFEMKLDPAVVVERRLSGVHASRLDAVARQGGRVGRLRECPLLAAQLRWSPDAPLISLRRPTRPPWRAAPKRSTSGMPPTVPDRATGVPCRAKSRGHSRAQRSWSLERGHSRRRAPRWPDPATARPRTCDGATEVALLDIQGLKTHFKTDRRLAARRRRRRSRHRGRRDRVPGRRERLRQERHRQDGDEARRHAAGQDRRRPRDVAGARPRAARPGGNAEAPGQGNRHHLSGADDER